MNKVKINDRTTLLLDYAWMPIGVLTARASFKHFYKNRITGLDKNKNQLNFKNWNKSANLFSDNPCISSAKNVWALPTVAIVTEKFFRKFKKKEYTFDELCIFHGFKCQICLNVYPRSQLSVEHVEPKSKHGTNFTENKTITCRKCNCKKGSVSPYYSKDGKILKGTKIPQNFIFIDKKVMRKEWEDFIWHK